MRWLKRISFVLLLVVFTIGGWYTYHRIEHKASPIKLTTVEVPSPKAEVSLSTIRVAAYNIAHGRGGKLGTSNWDNDSADALRQRLDQIATQINAVAPDILVLNEIDFDTSWSFGFNQAEYLAKKCGYPYVLQQRNFGVSLPFYHLHFGNALLSKYPITNAEFLKFPPLSMKEDIFAGDHDGFICDVAAPGQTLSIVGVHLEYRDESTRLQSAKIIQTAAEQRTKPVIAMGDFNSAPDANAQTASGENTISYLLANGFTASMTGAKALPTFPSEKPERKIDWILGSTVDGFRDGRVIQSNYSDHLMVAAEVDLPPPAE
ncbi:endonuclease/exonuclease/phosphatase family protein [Cerasicoccus maritimus]|uniref:endonuclease/exonuclease/phosphatase family protein n=1 Tax=Cerasicoccus maritimus TaxID=490089 RepID=UPI0028524BE8|nr:endonuclease/exonuclease/phosphatase family protein [Cerasicoccus maritimus]